MLKIDIGGYGALRPGRRGRAVLRGDESVALHGETAGRPGKRDRATKVPDEVDQTLYGRLKQLRLDIAREEGVPAYVIFHDRSLMDMASRNPRSLDALATCHGVGARKLERYGTRFLAALNETEDRPGQDMPA